MATNQHRVWDRHLQFALLIALAVLIPRGVVIAIEHSACWDDDYHLYRGLLLLRGDLPTIHQTTFNDPPVGEALSAIPALLREVHLNDPALVFAMSPAHPPPPNYCFTLPDSVRIETAIWKSILFLPLIAVVFVWLRKIYSLASAWLAVGLILVEPTLAAHIPLPTVDVLGMEGIVVACWASWRFVQVPNMSRAIIAGACIGLAMVIKHTAAVMPIAALGYAALDWLIAKRLWKTPRILGRNIGLSILAAFSAAFCIWALMLFEVGRVRGIPFPIPAATYVRSFLEGMTHAQRGHENFLLGESRELGWWYYFPVVATYKIPLGIFVVLAIGIFSLKWRKLSYQELPFILAAALWMALLLAQHIDIGFRHFLPVEIFLLMLASRCVAGLKPSPGDLRSAVAGNGETQPPRASKWVAKLAWVGVGVTAVELAFWTPDYLSYTNFPRSAVYLDISDSNLDWGQGLKELQKWMDAQTDDGRPIYFGYFGPIDRNLYTELGPRLMEYSSYSNWVVPFDGVADPVTRRIPDHGILVLSPVALTGQYDHYDRYAAFRRIKPDQVIGHCLLVYDLDGLWKRGEIDWMPMGRN